MKNNKDNKVTKITVTFELPQDLHDNLERCAKTWGKPDVATYIKWLVESLSGVK